MQKYIYTYITTYLQFFANTVDSVVRKYSILFTNVAVFTVNHRVHNTSNVTIFQSATLSDCNSVHYTVFLLSFLCSI